MVLRAERYVKLDVAAGSARVVVSLTLGPSEARRVLEAADQNGDSDGVLTQEEADAYMAQWGEGLETDLPVDVDGHAVPLSWGEAYLDPIGPVQAVPATVEMIARVPLEAGARRIVVHDRMRIDTFDRTDIAFRVRDGARLVASGVGQARVPPVRDVAVTRETRRSDEGFTYVAEVEVPGDAGEGGGAAWWWWAGAGGIVVVAIGGVVMRRKARPRDS